VSGDRTPEEEYRAERAEREALWDTLKRTMTQRRIAEYAVERVEELRATEACQTVDDVLAFLRLDALAAKHADDDANRALGREPR
jgi:neutral trehalase